MQRIPCSFIAVLGVISAPLAASAQIASPQGAANAGASGAMVFAGAPARTQRNVTRHAHWPTPAWEQFRTTNGSDWQVVWDVDTRMPLTIFGVGIAAPGAVGSAARAERHSAALLHDGRELFAPGARADDFTAIGNWVHAGMRTVVFQQHYRGLPVRGGTISFTFKRDRLIVIGSTAWPDVALATDLSGQGPLMHRSSGPARESGERQARTWIASDFGIATEVVESRPLEIIATVRTGARPAIEYALALPVTVAALAQPGRWRVYADADTGAPIMRESLLLPGTGQLLYNAPERWPGGARADWPAVYAETTVDSEFVLSDGDGWVSWMDTGNPAELFARPRGQYVWVEDLTGTDPVFSSSLADGGSAVWNVENDELTDAMLTTYVHLNRAKERVRSFDPNAGWLANNLLAEVNLDQACNAVYDFDNDSLLFFQRGESDGVTCGNTGRMADVIYHEFGHALHVHSLAGGQFDQAFSEGASDYFAAAMTGDPAIGVGFFETPEPLRHIDPIDVEYRWPDDIDTADPHQTGLIFAGAMWDLRAELIAAMGQEAGDSHADMLFYAALQRTPNIPSSYAYILAADDDDGNLDNGSPNRCAIDRAFGAHGLALGELSPAIALDGPVHDGLNIFFTMRSPDNFQCPVVGIERATLDWRVRGDPDQAGSQIMGMAEDILSAGLPELGENLVLEYQVNVVYENGTTLTFPQNRADPFYQLFRGPVVEHYCTDFETEPYPEGWTSVAPQGLNSWAWGMSTGAGQDPGAAYSGQLVVGTNLVSGSYPLLSLSQMVSPIVDVSGYDNVRLQYRRWLTIEDGKWDNARILANWEQVWDNLSTEDGLTNHTDREWRFHDIDITEQAAGGTVQVQFELESDDIIELGGWTIDDVCIVSYMESNCGDGIRTTDEQCDEGESNSNGRPNACRENCVAAFCGDGVTDAQEQCDDGNNVDTDTCDNACIGENPSTSGCCSAGGLTPDTPFLGLLVCAGIALILRRRRRICGR